MHANYIFAPLYLLTSCGQESEFAKTTANHTKSLVAIYLLFLFHLCPYSPCFLVLLPELQPFPSFKLAPNH
ncbi:hypothetical protein AX774_g1970 [Zancudomyces culisetae]|uniref:Uncharacterized protein n=1 Tax=Zancudomyces culisetae TaxID=1213189 RepID=A0A1R1PU71_ZANCU|nr:hypothetical protein AX774_g1970 [Zancudomyces culisetae]|eukprot:OMH84501.1 hypothetical protein AX774_g1970 [Zancudomyces culisetae]